MIEAPTKLRLKILSDPANLAGVRQAVELVCSGNGFDKQACQDVGLCVNEALANVIRHAYDGAADKHIEVTAEFSDGSVRIAIRDWGNGVVPRLQAPMRRDPLQPGGLGLICLDKMMDQVFFTPQPDGGMLLEMTRKP